MPQGQKNWRSEKTESAYRSEWERIKSRLVAAKKGKANGHQRSGGFPLADEGLRLPKNQSADLEVVSFNFWKIRTDEKYKQIVNKWAEDQNSPGTATKLQSQEFNKKDQSTGNKKKKLTRLLDLRLMVIYKISEKLTDRPDPTLYYRLCIDLFKGTEIYDTIQNKNSNFLQRKGLAWALQKASEKLSQKFKLFDYFEIIEKEKYLGNPVDPQFLNINRDEQMGWTGQYGFTPVFNESKHAILSMQFLPRVGLIKGDITDFDDWDFQISIRKEPLSPRDFQALCEIGTLSHSFSGALSERAAVSGIGINESNENFIHTPAYIEVCEELNWVIVPGEGNLPTAALERRTVLGVGWEFLNEYDIIFPIQGHWVELVLNDNKNQKYRERKIGLISGKKKFHKEFGYFTAEIGELIGPKKVFILEKLLGEIGHSLQGAQYFYLNDGLPLLNLSEQMSAVEANWLGTYDEKSVFGSMRKTLAASPSQPVADGRLTDVAEFALDTGWDEIESNIDYYMTAMGRAVETKTAVLNSFRGELFAGREKRYREVISRI